MAGMEIASLFAKVSADTSDFSRGMDQVKRDLGDAETGMGRVAGFMGGALKVAAGVGIAAVGALATGIGAATMKAAEFEQGIADIGAMMNLTAEDTATLEDHIMDLGLDPNLKVSADEAAGAVMALGTAGLDLQQIMKGASKATVLMANATGLKGKEGFAKAASIATDVMAQFKIEAEDLDEAVSKIAGTTIASKFSIDDYALAIAQAGGVAGAVGVDFDDFNATIAAISPSFASGSDAGTSLKTFLQRMIPTTKDATATMKELGLITTDWARASEYLSQVLGYEVEPNATAVYAAFQQTAAGSAAAAEGQKALGKAFNSLASQYEENQFFDDVTGQMKGMDEVAGLLQTAFADLTEEQKIEAATTLFGTDAMRAAFGVMDAGKEGIQEYKAAIGDVNAEDLAAKRMDTLSGSWEIFQGVLDTLTLQIGTAFLPAARSIVEWATELAQDYGPGVISFFESLASIIATLVTGDFEPLRAMLNEKLPAAVESTRTALTILDSAFATTDKETGEVINNTTRNFDEFTKSLVDTLDSGLGLAMIKVATFTANMALSIQALDAAAARDWEAMWTALARIEVNKQLEMAAQQEFYNKTMTSLMKMGGEASVAGYALGISTSMGKATGAMTDLSDAVTGNFTRALEIHSPSGVFKGYGQDIVQGLIDGINSMWQSLVSKAQSLATLFPSWMRDLLGISSPSRVMSEMGEDTVGGFFQGINIGMSELVASMGGRVKTQMSELIDSFDPRNNGMVQAEDGSWVPKSFYTSGLIQAEDGSWVPKSFYTSGSTWPIRTPMTDLIDSFGPSARSTPPPPTPTGTTFGDIYVTIATNGQIDEELGRRIGRSIQSELRMRGA